MSPKEVRPGRQSVVIRTLSRCFLQFLLPVFCCAPLAVSASTNMIPIALTGWNRDVVVESNAVGPPYTAYAVSMNYGEGTALYQTGLPQYAWGLPPSGAFSSLVGDGTLFQFQPYTTNNALLLSPDTGVTNGTLTLTTPATYGLIGILAHSGNGSNLTGTLTINFTDLSTYTTTFYAPDWYGGTTDVAYFGNAKIYLSAGGDDGGTINPRFYQTTINLDGLLGTNNKPIASFTFGKAVAASTAIYAVSGALSSGAPPTASPIAATGWNRDLVVEAGSAGPPYTTAVEMNPGEGNAFYQKGLAGKSYGLPVNGRFTSPVDGATFQLQPYTGNNALVMNTNIGSTQGTLTLTTPAIFNRISVIANSANATAGSAGSLTLNFQDGSSYLTNYAAPDWFYNTVNVALQGFERVNLASGATQGAPTDPRFYETTIDLTALFGATNKALSSVTFGEATGVGSTAVYAISGVPANQSGGAYTLATVANTPATGVQTRSATLNGTVMTTGGTAPEVFLYYGTVDHGTNAAAWANSVSLGPVSGTFSQTVSGLTPNVTYYYAAAAINPAGTAWATPSQSFFTTAPAAPGVTNFPAFNVTATGALLAGNILSTGGDAPAVTIYYGTFNGGTIPGAWANSAVIAGAQNGWFGKIASGLAANTTYYFTALAVNAGGATWASPVASFTTLASNPPPSGLVGVLTGRADNGRTGQNTNETMLTPANVNSNSFGRIFSYTVDGCVLGQPLIMPNVTIPGQGAHNVAFVATMHDSVYAFDADSNAGPNAAPLWQVSFINPSAGITTMQSATDLQASSSPGFYGPEVGISGTPVIDVLTGTLYVEAKTKEVTGNLTNFVHRVHALDVTTGAEKFGGPVVVSGTVSGIGDGFTGNGTLDFNSYKHMNRPALLLMNGILCVSFTGHQDFPPYHGWVFTYDAYTLQPLGVYNTTPNGAAGGIWQATSGPAGDAAGNIYFESGNGSFDATHGNMGDAVVKLSTAGGLNLADYFAPASQLNLNLQDLDIGSAGVMLLPDAAGSANHPHLMVAGSKTGVFWLLDRDNLGQFNAGGDTQIVQEISGATGGMWVTPAYFNGQIYYSATGDYVKGFAISNAVINTTPLSQSTATIGYPGQSLMVSANGVANGIVWGLQTSGAQSSPAVLHAYNATNLAVELYNSSQNASRDNPGNAVRYTMPTIANGKVYVGTVSSLSVFGNLSFLPTPVIAPNGGIYTNSVLVTITTATNPASIYYTLDGSIPTTNSILYAVPFLITNNVGVQAITAVPGQPNSAVAAASFFNSTSLGNGTGLTGQYYSNSVYTSPFMGTPLVRVDPTINFNWNSGPPDPSFPTNNYTVRWTGMVQPLFAQTYTFTTTTDDGARLYVNGQLLFDHFTPQSPTSWSGSIALQALQLYPIEMDYFQQGGGAIAQLSWSSGSTAQAIIPQSQLYPFTSPLPVLFSSPGGITNGVFTLQLTGMPGKTYVLQASTDLVNWTPISTNVPPATIQTLIDANAANFPQRFYRAVQLP